MNAIHTLAARPAGASRAQVLRLIAPADNYQAFDHTELTLPALAPNEVRVRMRALSLNRRDLNLAAGLPNWRIPLPRIPLSDGAGDVIAIGSAVTQVKIGDRVASLFWPHWLDGPASPDKLGSLGGSAFDGVARTIWQTAEHSVIALPDYLSEVEAATLPTAALTAWNALRSTTLAAGDPVLIQGTGTVSLFALQIATRLGLRTLISTRRAEHAEALRSLGANEVIVRNSGTDWVSAVRAASRGEGAALVLDPIGGSHLTQSLEAARFGGTVTVFGGLGGDRAELDSARIWERGLSIRSVLVGSRADFAAMLRAFEHWHLHPLIASEFDWRELPAAMRAMAAEQQLGKIVLRVEP